MPKKSPPTTFNTELSPIALFGGTFDPFHRGHLNLANQLARHMLIEKFYFVPARQNPLKTLEPRATAKDRLQMIRLGLAEKRNPKKNPLLRILDWEIKKKGPSYTIDTVRRMTKKLGRPVTLVMGDEVFREIPRWKNPKKLFSLCDCAIITRNPRKSINVGSVLSKIGLKAKRKGSTYYDPKTHRIIKVVQITPLPFSSTEIRRKIQKNWESNNLPHITRGIQRSVWQFIKAKQLYAVTR
jgi:nicotinate-nucleotide adenylyltransferase